MIANTPDVREVFERDGYNREFTAHDVFPLLQVFVAQAGGKVATGGTVDEPPARSSSTWLLAGFLVLVFAILVYALVTNASSQMM